jgi:hypothetical protein
MGYENEAKQVIANLEQKKEPKPLKNIRILIGRLKLLDETGYDIEQEIDWNKIVPGSHIEVDIKKTRPEGSRRY